MIETGQRELLSARQAHEAAYRFVARYYDYERSASILRLLEAISSPGDHPNPEDETWVPWRQCIQETLDGAPLPELPSPWGS
jgi:hypothetical protein